MSGASDARAGARRLWLLTGKELLQLARDPWLVGFILYSFTLNLYLAADAISLQLRDAATVIHDEDRSFASRDLVSLLRPPTFRVVAQASDDAASGRMLDRGDAMVAITIPPRFAATLTAGRPARIQMEVDATNPGLALFASTYAAQIADGYGRALAARSATATTTAGWHPAIIDDHRVWFNPNQTDAWGTSIIQLLVMITVLSILLPASAMVREKERGTVEQLLIAPLSPLGIMVPKIIAMTGVILAVSVVSLYGLLHPIFALPIRGSATLFFAVTTLFVFTTSGMGLFLATVARNQAQVGMVLSAAIPPMVFLSGAWSPREAMPGWLRIVMDLSPLHYYLDVSFGILLKGAPLRVLWEPIGALAVIGGATLGFGVWRFRRQFA